LEFLKMNTARKIGLSAALAGALALGVSGCDSTTATSTVNTVLAYACPIAIAVDASALVLTVAEKATVQTAVADCNIYMTTGIAGLTAPASVATAVVEALLLIQQNPSAPTALAPDMLARLNAGHAKLLELKHMPRAFFSHDNFGAEAGAFLAHVH
jgi:hypothetical protein